MSDSTGRFIVAAFALLRVGFWPIFKIALTSGEFSLSLPSRTSSAAVFALVLRPSALPVGAKILEDSSVFSSLVVSVPVLEPLLRLIACFSCGATSFG